MQYSGIQIFAKSNPKQIDVLHLRDNHLSGTFPKTNWTMNSNYLESEFHHPILPLCTIFTAQPEGAWFRCRDVAARGTFAVQSRTCTAGKPQV
ncbi:hypothetical protein CDAR_424281 [Caerostris darwini]|uniref:Uncharacterized protein n=1 Tax=Caerostris darwini TaxID=1538125 RepID=A0AAV4T226_9ARAC|nr:hypothetical protein CDAR_424281 [Caerostris darwini]